MSKAPAKPGSKAYSSLWAALCAPGRVWTTLRARVWRWGLPYKARRGWESLLREVVAAEVWIEPASEYAAPVVGAPLEWSLLHRLPDGRLQGENAVCAWHGVPIHGSPGAGSEIPWGVRCCRCGEPIRVGTVSSGMQTSFDPPSCIPCRPLVKLEILRAKLGF